MKRNNIRPGQYVAPCPKCGRKPNIKVFGVNYARVECKPVFRKRAHLSVFVGYHQPSVLMNESVKAWNKAADCANLPVW